MDSAGSSSSSSLYKGVRQRMSGKWVSEIRDPSYKTKSRIWLGSFPNPEMAAVAYDVAALALHGKAAVLNFPGGQRRLPLPASTSHDDIRRAAVKAATDHLSIPFLNDINMNGEEEYSSSSTSCFVDEEAIFNMPLVVDSMAEGMLLTPPAMKKGFNWTHDHDDFQTDFTLWSD